MIRRLSDGSLFDPSPKPGSSSSSSLRSGLISKGQGAGGSGPSSPSAPAPAPSGSSESFAGDAERDERLGEAIEAYMDLLESPSGDEPPEPAVYAARFPDLYEDLRAALDGLALVRKLTGSAGSGPGRSAGMAAFAPGRRVAGYRIVRQLGRGGMGTVYEAVHVDLDRPVALKVLTNSIAVGGQSRRRFLNEAKTAAGLHHTRIVPVFDVGQEDGVCYYAMQRIEGCGLDRMLRSLRAGHISKLKMAMVPGATATAAAKRSVIQEDDDSRPSSQPRSESKREGPPPKSASNSTRADDSSAGLDLGFGLSSGLGLDPYPVFEPPSGALYHRWVAQVGAQAADALAYAHQFQIIHRDIKPSNLLVDQKGMIWVADFGLARRLADPSQTQSGNVLGTPKYMSPEQAASAPVDGRADIYSLGATLYELLTLRPPFDGQSFPELSHQILNRDPIPPRAFDKTIPRDLETIVLKALAKRAPDRYQTAEELLEDLNRFLNRQPVKARRISLAGRFWRFARRHPGVSAVTAAAAAAVTGVVGVAYVHISYERDIALGARDELRVQVLRSLENEAKLLERSDVPNRREQGMSKIRRAAAMNPSANQILALRDQAVSFLASRDVVPKQRIETGAGRTQGMTFLDGGERIAALIDNRRQQDGRKRIEVWDAKTGASLNQVRIPDRSSVMQYHGGIASYGQMAIIPGDDSAGLQWIDPLTGKRDDPVLTNFTITGILAGREGDRLITADFPRPAPDLERGRERGPDRRSLRPPDDWQVRLWDLKRLREPIQSWPMLTRVNENAPYMFSYIDLSEDGKTVVIAPFEGALLSVHSGVDGSFQGDFETFAPITAVAAGRDRLAAAALKGGAVLLWHTDSGTPLPLISSRQSNIRHLRFSSDGTLLAAAGDNAAVEVWDIVNGELLATLPVKSRVDALRFASKGGTLAASGDTGELALWDVTEPLGMVRPRGLAGPIRSLAFRADGLLAISDTAGVWFWDPKRCWASLTRSSSTETAESSKHEPESVASAAQADDGKTDEPASGAPSRIELAAFDDQGRLIQANWRALTLTEPSLEPQTASSSSHDRASRPLVPLFRMPIPDPPFFPVGNPRLGPASRMASPTRLSQSPNGKYLVLRQGRQSFFWRSDSPDQLTRLPVRDRDRRIFDLSDFRLGDLAVAPDGRVIYVLDRFSRQSQIETFVIQGDAAVRVVRDQETGRNRDGARADREKSGVSKNAQAPNDNSESSGPLRDLTALAIHPDGRWLAAGRQDGQVLILDASSLAVLWTLTPQEGESAAPIATLQFSPQGRELAIAAGQKVRLWRIDPEAKTPPAALVRLPIQHGAAQFLAFRPSGRMLAIGGADNSVEIWDLDRIREELLKVGVGWEW